MCYIGCLGESNARQPCDSISVVILACVRPGDCQNSGDVGTCGAMGLGVQDFFQEFGG